MKRALPPKVGAIKDGSVEWTQLGEIDFDLLGYFLSSHLIIEHYIDEMLRALHGELNWNEARLTFSQKLSLFSNFEFPDKYDSLEAIRHLNSLRNKLSHRVGFKISPADLAPIQKYLVRLFEDKSKVPDDPHDMLELFCSMVCAFFAGSISAHAQMSKDGADDA